MSSYHKIRVALIGLNAPHEGLATGTSWAATAHMPYLTATDKFELVALQNSSIERAQKAIHAYGLDPSLVRAYGSAEGSLNGVPLGFPALTVPLRSC